MQNENLIQNHSNLSEDHTSVHSSNVEQYKYTGYGYIAAVVAIWVCSSFVIQFVESDSVSPFSLTVLSSCSFTILLVFDYIKDLFSKETKEKTEKDNSFRLSVEVFPIWFFANYFYNLSLTCTGVTSSTVLSSTSSMFTYIISLLMKSEEGSVFKLIGVLVSFVGITLTSVDNSSVEEKDSFVGNIFAILSAILYGVYSVYFKIRLREDSEVSKVFGYIGLLSSVVLLPIVVLFERFRVGLLLSSVELIFLNSLFNNVIGDVLWAKAVVYTSPTIVTVGICFTIPLTGVLDVLINSVEFSNKAIYGSLCVIVGFLCSTQ